MVKYAGFYPSDKPDPETPRPAAGVASAPRMRLASIAEDADGSFQEERTMDISLRSTDFGVGPTTQPLLRDRAMLLRMDGIGAGQVLSVDQTPFTMGRHATNQLPIDDDSISRFHARFVCEEGKYFVEDLGSRNGTFLQGKRITRAEIKDDDWVQLGARVAFRFTLTDSRQEGLLRKLYESSTRDALTGAYNRRHFDDRLRAEI
ncbi:MAG TPA: FHA domain-containing protein, partial [Polyangiaceae bacterium]